MAVIATSVPYRDDWFPQPHQHRNPQGRLQAAAPNRSEIRRPPLVAKTATLQYPNDHHIAAFSVHSAETSNILLPEPYDWVSSGSSSASYSQPASPQRSATRSSDAAASGSEERGVTDDGRHCPKQELPQKQNRNHNIVDPEKHQVIRQGMCPGDAGLHWRHMGTVRMDPESAINEAEIEKATPNILLFLAIVNPLLSLAVCLYTLVIATFLTVSLPLQLCSKISPFSSRLARSLSPFIQLQCRLIYSLLKGDSDACRPIRLLLLHLTSPLLALGIALAAWVAAVFWVYAAMLGDPDGRGRGDDGRQAVLSVRQYWERILGWALR